MLRRIIIIVIWAEMIWVQAVFFYHARPAMGRRIIIIIIMFTRCILTISIIIMNIIIFIFNKKVAECSKHVAILVITFVAIIIITIIIIIN